MMFFIFILTLNFILNFPESNGYYGLLIHHTLENVVSFLLNHEPMNILLDRAVSEDHAKLCSLLVQPQHIYRSDTASLQDNLTQLICRECNVNGISLHLSYDNVDHEMFIPTISCPGKKKKMYLIAKFHNYDKYIAFWETPSNEMDGPRYLDMAVVTDYLSLKHTGIAAFNYIENLESMDIFQRWIEILRICASLFMNLQYVNVESQDSYYIKSVRIGNEEKCICYKYESAIGELTTILAYTFSIAPEQKMKKTLILKRNSLTEKFTAFIIYPKNMLL